MKFEAVIFRLYFRIRHVKRRKRFMPIPRRGCPRKRITDIPGYIFRVLIDQAANYTSRYIFTARSHGDYLAANGNPLNMENVSRPRYSNVNFVLIHAATPTLWT